MNEPSRHAASAQPAAPGGPPPFLSVLIPAYEYPEGVHRILQALAPTAGPAVEILIHDDSRSDRVQAVAMPWMEQYRHLVHYRRNPSPGGAVRNWNGLLEAARGQYLLLLHHDELPLSPSFCEAIQQEIQASGSPRALVLDLQIADQNNTRLRRHVPLWSKRALLRLFPSYLYLRNIVGAPSSWVLRREGCPTFDPDLQWLVDVDWYIRSLAGSGPIRVSSRVKIASVGGENRTITASLGSAIPRLRGQEAAYLLQTRASAPVLGLLLRRSLKEKAFAAVESALWMVFRACTIPFLRAFPSRPAHRLLRERLRLHPVPSRDGVHP